MPSLSRLSSISRVSYWLSLDWSSSSPGATLTSVLLYSQVEYLLNLYQDPAGDRVFSTSMTAQSRSSEDQNRHELEAKLPNLTDLEKIDLLNAHIQSLEEKLALRNKKIRELECTNS